MAYQGFATGDAERDAFPVRQFIKDGHNVTIAQSFAKNFGLYGERVGALTIVTEHGHQAESVESQLKILVRPIYSSPPITGARIVAEVLGDPALNAQWRTEVKIMADRIIQMREKLVEKLKAVGSQKDWSHITKQNGMFGYTGLLPEQVDRLGHEHHCFMTKNGRINVAALTNANVEHLAKSMKIVAG